MSTGPVANPPQTIQDLITEVGGFSATISSDNTAVAAAQAQLASDTTALEQAKAELNQALSVTGPIFAVNPDGSITVYIWDQTSGAYHTIQAVPATTPIPASAANGPGPAPPVSQAPAPQHALRGSFRRGLVPAGAYR